MKCLFSKSRNRDGGTARFDGQEIPNKEFSIPNNCCSQLPPLLKGGKAKKERKKAKEEYQTAG
jgi:hypothetical protein